MMSWSVNIVKKVIFQQGVMLGIVFGLFGSFQTQAAASPRISASFSIIGDLVKHVAGPDATVNVLVGPNTDVHAYEPTSTDMVEITQSDVIFAHGFHLEHWLEDIQQSTQTKAKVVALAEGIINPRIDKETGELDPHTWHQVSNVIAMVKRIEEEMSLLDPEHAKDYKQRAQAYIQLLINLDNWIKVQVASLPYERRILFTSHDTFGYFAQTYGFKVVGTAIESATTEVADPSAKHFKELIQKVAETKVKVIFTENVISPKVIQTLADESGIRVAASLYTDALGEPGSSGSNYIDMMRANVLTMVKELKQP